VKIGLAMIVKDEQDNIVRALETVKDAFDVFCINYSGSTDSTLEVGEKWMEENEKDGIWICPEWNGAADGLNATIEYLAEMEVDWVLRIDADSLFTGTLPDFEKLDQDTDGIDTKILRNDGTFIASRPWLFKTHCRYKGVRHEGLYCNQREEQTSFTITHADDSGARPRSPETYADDFQQMGGAIPGEYDSMMVKRYAFYMANSARDGGDLFQAAMWFRLRMTMGGYAGEVEVSAREHALIMGQPHFWLDAINKHPNRPDMVFWALATAEGCGGVPFKAQVLEMMDAEKWEQGCMFMQADYAWKTRDMISIAYGELGQMEKSLDWGRQVLVWRDEIHADDLARILSRIGESEGE